MSTNQEDSCPIARFSQPSQPGESRGVHSGEQRLEPCDEWLQQQPLLPRVLWPVFYADFC